MTAKSDLFRINASGVPKPTGLYDPRNDHDSCGVGFIARIDGVSLHAVVEQGIRILVNLEHRGALGGDKSTGDGAGLLVEIPDTFFRQVCPGDGLYLPRAGRVRRGDALSPHGRSARRAVLRSPRTDRRRGRMPGPRVARGAGRPIVPRGSLRVHPSADPPAVPRARNLRGGRLRAEAVRHPPPRREEGRLLARRRRQPVLHSQPLRPDDRLQGAPDRVPAPAVLPGPEKRTLHEPVRRGPPAVQHEHASHLAPRAPVPDRRPQRRDQHAAGEHQPDAGPGGEPRLAAVRQRHRKAAPHHQRGGERLRHLRQRPRAPRDVGPVAAARGDDDDPRVVGPQVPDERGQAVLLRVPLRDHGAVGRAGGDGLLRRAVPRRHPRPERAASRAVHRDPRRDDRPRLGDRGDGHPAGPDRPARPAPAGEDAPPRPAAEADRPGQRDQGGHVPPEAVPEVGQGQQDRAAGDVRPVGDPARRPGDAPAEAARLRLHRGGDQAHHHPDGVPGAGGGRLDGGRRGAGGPLEPAAGRSSPTSSSSSPR